jgi:pantetheine-phosphate adenylyltransferase
LKKQIIAIYPGSFDPPTNGHLDLIERGAKIFDVLIVAVLRNSAKAPLFSTEERLSMLRETTKKWSTVRVDSFEGLLVDFAIKRGAKVVLRGIRAVSDYEYELQMALMNRKLDARLETMFMIPAGAYSYLSSGLVREITALGGSVCNLVPKPVEQMLKQKLLASPRKSRSKTK